MEYIPFPLADALGGRDTYLKLPIFNVGESKHDYIDYIDPSSMSHSIMRGVESQRKFVAFRLTFTTTDGKVEPLTCVLFQRYTNELTCVSASCPAGVHKDFITTGSRKIIETLISKGKVDNVENPYLGVGTYALV